MSNLVEKALKIGGVFDVKCYDPTGQLKWQDQAKNIVVNGGLDHILDVIFHGVTAVDPWYVGLKGSGSVSSADTLATHGGWTEATGYTGDRKEYEEAAASSQSITNSANVATYTISSTATIAGAFLASVTGATGTLMCVADFAAAKGVASDDTLEVTYTISAADDGS